MRYWLTGFLLISLLATLAPAAANKASKVDVSVSAGKFSPASVNISTGDSVVWTNKDNVDHQIVADDGSFSSGKLKPGETFSKTFAKAGTTNYSCSLHPREKGSVVVK